MATTTDVAHITKLKDSETYAVWKFQIDIFFEAAGTMSVVNGESKLADATDKPAWSLKDAKARKLIVSTVDNKIVSHLLGCTDSKSMYDTIVKLFDKDDDHRKCSLLESFYNFKFDSSKDIATNIANIRNIVHKLKSLEQTIDDAMLIARIVTALPEKYEMFITAWESTVKAEKTIDNLISRLINVESKQVKSNSEEVTQENAFIVGHKNSKFQKFSCTICHRKGHTKDRCRANGKTSSTPAQQGQAEPQVTQKEPCKHCGRKNHKSKDCRFKPRQETAYMAGGSFTDDDHVMDSGTTIHLSMNEGKLVDKRDFKRDIGTAKADNPLNISKIGTLKTCVGDFQNVHYSSELSQNLLSIGKIADNGSEIVFTKEKVFVTKEKIKLDADKIEFQGHRRNGLYVVNFNEDAVLFTNDTETSLWHKKTGHMCKNYLKVLPKIVNGVNINENDLSDCDGCEVCFRAKQSRRPFKRKGPERKRATRLLEIIHTDVCQVNIADYRGCKYFVTFIDDFSHFTETFIIKAKNEVQYKLREYVNRVENQHNLRVFKTRCDNGKEYVNKNILQFCREKGIVLDLTIIYTPQLNGRAERMNRTLMDKTRALLFQSNAPLDLWSEALLCANYIINRSPTSALEHSTPAEIWYGERPDLSNLQVFGAVAYSKILHNLKKLDDRSEKLTFVGYAPHGFKLWDSQQRTIKIRSDVIVDNDKMNFSSKQGNSNIFIVEETNPEKVVITEIVDDPEIQATQDQNDENVNSVPQFVELNLDANSSIQEDVIANESDLHSRLRPRDKIALPERYRDNCMLTYSQAIKSEDSVKWQQAIDNEKQSLEKNQVWDIVDKSECADKKILTSKWVFKIKEDGSYKARLVIRGFQQEAGIDYHETFSPVVNISALRLLMALSSENQYKIKRFDIKTAFLYGTLKEEIFMEIPEGYGIDKRTKVCLLRKSLYGLKQAPYEWNNHFRNFLLQHNLCASDYEPCIFYSEARTLFLAVFVDDGYAIGKEDLEIDTMISSLEKDFEISLYENPDSFLNVELERTQNSLVIRQEKYAQQILSKFEMDNPYPTRTPIVIQKGTNTTATPSQRQFPYRECVGSLLYLSNKTRPDLTFALNYESRHLNAPKKENIDQVQRTLRYLKGTTSFGIQYYGDSSNTELIAYCDADFANDTSDRKSLSGFVIFFKGGPISWSSKKQPIVALSTTEAELIAATECVKECLFLKGILSQLLKKHIEVKIYMDNQSAMNIINSCKVNHKTKHIDIRFKFIFEKIRNRDIRIFYSQSKSNVADIFTKDLTHQLFTKHRDSLVVKGNNR